MIATYLIPLLAVLAGCIIGLYIRPKNKKKLKLLLVFSGSFLLSLTIIHLLPDLFQGAHSINEKSAGAGLFIILGMALQIALEYLSKGAEHGHVHAHSEGHTLPWLLFASLSLHALLEGVPLSHQFQLAWGIGIHHLPIAIILTLFMVHSNIRTPIIVAFMLFFALMTPLGTFLLVKIPFLHTYYQETAALVVGILFHISSTIIFESSEKHQFNSSKLLAILAGFAAAYFV
jgi:hypothetical protein